jgi:putative tryptophan/tyrosine transport system substrate-binding protein
VIAGQRIGGLLCAADPFFFSRRAALVALTVRHRVPAIFEFRDFVDAGGLMSYGTDLGGFLPTTAKVLGLKIPESFLLRADEVIE